VKKRRLSFLLLVIGVLLWIGGGAVILFSDILGLQIAGLVLFAAGPAMVFGAGRMLRPGR
jgi:hypothetical protein